jgi:hypothetical protein
LMACLVFGASYSLAGPLVALGLSVALAYIIEKASSGREKGFIVHWASARAKGAFVNGIANTWMRLGLMSPPNHQNTYEP